MIQWLTSERNPLRIDTVAAPGSAGRIGMTLFPGKKDPYAAFGAWDRDLQADLHAIREWGASAVVSLVEAHEFTLLGVPDLGEQVARAFRWLWLPIPDGGVPDAAFEESWASAGPELHERLAAGERVLIHCRAGLGRTGTIASRLLVEAGMTPVQALLAVRGARPGTVETMAQEHYVLLLRRRATSTGNSGGDAPGSGA
jgi:ADP-ribosyl-[dinitrogen reductase] hydrolase